MTDWARNLRGAPAPPTGDRATVKERRRSCRFCRSRKLRCSGTSQCSACKDRHIECLYDSVMASKGPSDAPTVGQGKGTDHPWRAVPVRSHSDPLLGCHPSESKSVAEALNELAADLQGRRLGLPPLALPVSPQNAILGYRDLVVVLTQDLIDIAVRRVSILDHCPYFPDEDRIAGSKWDPCPQRLHPFEPIPLSRYDTHRTTQLIDVWFATHPLSMGLSKTLLLRSVRDNSCNQLLLATVLGGAQRELGDATALEECHALLQWAASHLHDIRTDTSDLPTAQALSLLAWHETCHGNVEQAMVYTMYAHRTVARLIQETSTLVAWDVRQANGIRLAKVEWEMLHVLGWVTLSLIVWYFTHSEIVNDDLPILAQMHTHPPIDKDDSWILRLDRAADNLSTLTHQGAWIPEIWIISHITAAAVHLRTINPDPIPAHSCWQTQLHHHLQPLHRPRETTGIQYDEAWVALACNARIIEANMEQSVSHTWILVSYQTLLIHLLFPCTGSIPITTPQVQQLAHIIEFFVDHFKILTTLTTAPSTACRSNRSLVSSYVTGLAACGSAIEMVSIQVQGRQPWLEPNISQGLGRLLDLAAQLDQLFASDTLLTDRRWRIVKDRFCRLSRAREDTGTADASGWDVTFSGLPPVVSTPAILPLLGAIDGLPNAPGNSLLSNP
ncbi:hypothetical protein ABOM_007795 [Aspergillus bombycis]|uniref:Zn(2)-C6 fungal-type domain-containing protein n=1 Tax=Aspergillus bombycis TaxID=109264 RepID=A0A1F7ZY94_9EURO|nr:hypothetical protein ABOM_007795 [Aspergillus bombycis]OGM44055.1 hypothetical protein ABOM_007795 [Aspergillus bombycis]